MSKYQPYPEYKDSSVEWLGEVPENWCVTKFGLAKTILTDYTANGSFADLAKNVTYKDTEDYARLVRLTDLRKDLKNNNGVWVDEKAYFFLKKSALFGGEFLMANVGAYAGLFYQMPYINSPASLAPNMFMAKFNPRIVSEHFMSYVGISDSAHKQLRLHATSSSAQPKLNKDNFKSIKFVYPSLHEQATIANFLDHETTKIDTLIEKQQELIKLLKEKRQAVISHAVTKGLNPNVKMKDSGVEWLGEVPEHWGVKKVKYLFKIRKRISGELGYPVLSITQKGIKVKDTESGKGQLSMDYSKYQFVEVGDFAMNHMDLLTGFVDISKYHGVTSPDYRVFTAKDKNLVTQYFLYLFQMGYINKIFYGFGQGSSQFGRWRLPTGQFENFYFPYPSLETQQEIADYLDKKLSQMDELEVKANQAITLLKERRTALISAAVTGKIDVRGNSQ